MGKLEAASLPLKNNKGRAEMESRPELILVIGGTGMLGEPVVRCLREAGFPVRVLTRSLEKARDRFEAGIEVVAGEVDDAPSLAAALSGCWGVHINLSGSFDYDLERRGAANVALAAAKAGLQRIGYISGASVLAENCWYAGTRAKYDAEAAIRGSGVPYTIFKATWFMETLDNFVRRPWQARQGGLGGKKRALHIGRHPFAYHWIAAQDYAQQVARAYAIPEAANKSFYIYGPQAYTMRQALQIYCRIAHPDAMHIFMPIWVAWVFATLGRREALKAALPFFSYMERVGEGGDPGEARSLLGAATTTLEEWSREKARQLAA